MDISHEIAKQAQNYNISEFIEGQRDCRDGVVHQSGNTESYNAGYSAQYQLEQILEHMPWNKKI